MSIEKNKVEIVESIKNEFNEKLDNLQSNILDILNPNVVMNTNLLDLIKNYDDKQLVPFKNNGAPEEYIHSVDKWWKELLIKIYFKMDLFQLCSSVENHRKSINVWCTEFESLSVENDELEKK